MLMLLTSPSPLTPHLRLSPLRPPPQVRLLSSSAMLTSSTTSLYEVRSRSLGMVSELIRIWSRWSRILSTSGLGAHHQLGSSAMLLEGLLFRPIQLSV